MLRVLIIDDEPDILKILTRIILFDYPDAQIETAPDGLQALNMANQEDYDVICTDYNMPNLNGIDFLKGIRHGRSNNQDALVLFITGYSPELDNDSALWENVFFIGKPFSDNKVMNYIKMSKVA